MARIVFSDEERDRRVELIGAYRLKTGETTRNIAKYFSSTQFKISNVTVLDYLDRYMKKHPNTIEIIEAQTKINTPETVKNPEVFKRVIASTKLIEEGFTIEEISKSFNLPYWVIYGDIKNRLPMIDKKLSDKINNILKCRSLSNLKNNKM